MLVFITLRTPSNKLLYHSKAELSFLCIYAFLYLILTAFCVFVLLKKAGGCRAVYITLLVSLSCSTISTVASVFNLVIQQGGITLPQSSASGHTILALSALVKLFNVWSLPFLFLSIYLLIRDGHLAVQKTHNSSVIPIASYVLFALIMVFGTVAVGLYLDYLSIIYIQEDWFETHTIAQLNHKIAVYFDLSYTFLSLWYLSAVVTLLYAAYVYRKMRHLSLNDKVSTSNISYAFTIVDFYRFLAQVMQTVLFGIMPAYILLIVEGMIITIVSAPGVIKFTNATQVEKINLSSVLLSNLFRAVMYGIMLAIGFGHKTWLARPADMTPRELLYFK